VTRSQLSWGIESFLDTTSRRSRCSLFAAAAGLLLLLVATSCGQRRFQPESLPVSQQMLSAVKSLRITIFTARCYACAVLAMVLCLSVCVCVCLSQVGVLLRRLNVGSHEQHHTIAQGI